MTGKEHFEIVAEAEDGLEAIRCVQKHSPDLLILDLSLPKLSGLSVLQDLKSRFPNVKVIALTVYDSEEYFKEVFQAVAVGFCLKRNSFGELLNAIDHVVDELRNKVD